MGRVTDSEFNDGRYAMVIQRAVTHVLRGRWTLVSEYVETESGRKSDRPTSVEGRAGERRKSKQQRDTPRTGEP